MNEIIVNNGGRRLHNDDLLAMQDHLMSIQGIFAAEKPFVISGLAYTNGVASGTVDISEGFLWLGGKIVFFAAKVGVTLSANLHIVIQETPSFRLQEDNTSKVTNTLYSTSGLLTTPPPISNDILKLGVESEVRRYYKNVLGDKYLQLDVSETQTITGDVALLGTLTSLADISTNGQLTAGALTVNNNAEIGGSILVEAASAFQDNLSVYGTLYVAEQLSANSNLSVAGQTFLTGNASVTGSLTTNGGIIANAQITANAGIVATGGIAADSISASNDVTFGDQLEVMDHIYARNNVYASGTVEATNLFFYSGVWYHDEINETSIKMIDSNGVTANKVSTSAIQDDAVVTDKISDGNVTPEKLSFTPMVILASGEFTTSFTAGGQSTTTSLLHGMGSQSHKILTNVKVGSSARAAYVVVEETHPAPEERLRFTVSRITTNPNYEGDAQDVVIQWTAYAI